jgi:hypothetical protein
VVATVSGVTCECCGIDWPTTKKYPALGYWCDTCMNDGCFGDDVDAQNPGGHGPYHENQKVVHARMVALFAP